MEFEREFNKVDKALSAAALSATIIHQSACSHQDIATLESLVPGMIFDNQWAYGFTNEASLENFQKVKEVVGNAIKTAIAKIKEMIKRFMDWVKGKQNISPTQAKEIAKTVNEATTSAVKAQEEVQSKSQKSADEVRTAARTAEIQRESAMGAWLAAKTPTSKENEAVVQEWLKKAKSENLSIIDAIIGTMDKSTFISAVMGFVTEEIPLLRKLILAGSGTFNHDGSRYTGVIESVGTLIKALDAVAEHEPDAIKDNNLFVVSTSIMELYIESCKNAKIKPIITSPLKPIDFTNDKEEYKQTVRNCLSELFKDNEEPLVAKNSFKFDDLNSLLTAMVNTKQVLNTRLVKLEDIIDDIEKSIAEEGDGDTPEEKLAVSAFLNETRCALDYSMRLNLLVNKVLVAFDKTYKQWQK